MVNAFEWDFSDLREARNSGQPWHVLAGFVRAGYRKLPKGWSAERLLAAASEASGLAPVMLQRYAKVIDKLERIALGSSKQISELLSPSFAAVEIAIRLYDRDEAAGLDALVRLKERKLTIDALRGILDDVRGGAASPNALLRSRMLAERASQIERYEAALLPEMARLLGGGTSMRRRPNMKFFARVGYELIGADSEVLAGCDLYLEPVLSEDPLEDLAKSLLLAFYFPAFYVVIAPFVGRGPSAEALRIIELLDMPSVGLVILDADGGARTERRAVRSEIRLPDYASISGALSAGRRS